MPLRLSAYGTLMAGEIMTLVAGISLEGSPARLPGYRRNRTRGEIYPGIRPDRQHSVDGVVYSGLPPAALQRLDLFEGQLYQRQPIRLELADGQTVNAETYVLRPEHYHRLTATAWSLEEFLCTGRDAFVAEYAGMAKLQKS